MPTEAELYQQYEEEMYQQYLNDPSVQASKMSDSDFGLFQNKLDQDSGANFPSFTPSTDQSGAEIRLGLDGDRPMQDSSIRTSYLSEQYPDLFNYGVKGPAIGAGGFIGGLVGGGSTFGVGTLAGAGTGGALAAYGADSMIQDVDNLWEQFQGRAPLEKENPITLRNTVEGALGGMMTPVLGGISAGMPASMAASAGPAARSRVSSLFSPSRIDDAILADPQNQTALNLAARKNPELLNSPVDDITRVGPNTQSALANMQNFADMPLEETIGAELGAQGGDTAVATRLAENFRRTFPAIRESGITDAQSVPEAIQFATTGAERAYAQKRAIAAELDPHVDIGIGDFANQMGPIRERINQLRLNETTRPIADAIEGTINSVMGDIEAQGAIASNPVNALAPQSVRGDIGQVNVSRVADMLENINEFRRNVLREFDSGNVARATVGDPMQVAAQRESVEALSEASDILRNALTQQLERAALNGRISPSQVGAFQRSLDEYAGYQAFEELGSQFHRGTLKGLSTRDPTRVVQNAGQDPIFTSFSPNRSVVGNALNGAWDWAKRSANPDPLTPAMSRMGNVLGRDQNAMTNIRDIMSLRESPVTLPGFGTTPAHPDLGMSALQSGAARVGDLTRSAFDLPDRAIGGIRSILGSNQTLTGMAGATGPMMTDRSSPPPQVDYTTLNPFPPAMADDGRPPGVKLSVTPSFQPDERPGNVPRHINAVDPRMVGSFLNQYVAPQDLMPLAIQATKIFSMKDPKETARFLGALSEKYPDMPFERGPITGLPSEWQMEDGSTKLFSDIDVQKWQNEIENSPLREDEKAQRMRALLTDGTVYPLDRKLNDFGPPVLADSAMNSVRPPDQIALENMMSQNRFTPREMTEYGSAKVEY